LERASLDGKELGEAGEDRFWVWVYACRVMIVASALLLILGLMSLYYSFAGHSLLMILGIRLFYYGIMWAQIPSYVGYMPCRALSLILLLAEISGSVLAILGYYVWIYILSLSGTIHSMIYIVKRGIGFSRLKAPNMLVAAGLIHSSAMIIIDPSPLNMLSFPLLSAISLLIRIDPPVLGYNSRDTLVYIFIAISITMLILSPLYGITTIMIIPGAVLIPLHRVHAKGFYGIGSTIAKITGLSIAIMTITRNYPTYIDITHMLLIGFLGVIMGSLCAPMIVPGIMGRAYRSIPPWIPVIVFIIAVARALYRIYMQWPMTEILPIPMLLVIIFYIYRILSSEKAL